MSSQAHTSKKSNKLKTEQMGKRLRFCRLLTEKTLREFAGTANVNHTTLSRYEKGITPVKDKNIDRIINLLLSHDIIFSQKWLMEGIGDSPVLKQPVQEQESDSELASAESESSTPLFLKDRMNKAFFINKEMDFFANNIPGAIIRYIEDDSMSPVFKQGEYVVGVRIGMEDLKKINGEYCIVILKNGKMIIRQFFTKKNMTSLVSVNTKNHPDPIHVEGYPEVVAPILYHRRFIKFR